MNIPKPRNQNKKRTILIGVTLLVIASIGIAVWYSMKNNNDASQQSGRGPTPQEQKQSDASDATQKQEFLDNEAKQQDSGDGNDQKPEPPSSQDITLTARADGDTVIVTTKLAAIASGTCTLTITGGTAPVTQQANVIYNPEYSTCAGFSVRKSAVNATSWNIALSVDTGSGKIEKSIKFTP